MLSDCLILIGLTIAYFFASYLRSEQVHIMCSMDELMPSIGTTVPSPSVLAVALSQSDYTLQDIRRLCPETEPFDSELVNPSVFSDESHIISKTHLISVSDDGNVWKWLMTAERFRDANKDSENVKKVDEVQVSEVGSLPEVPSAGQSTRNKMTLPDIINCREKGQLGLSVVSDEVSFKVGDLTKSIFSVPRSSSYPFEYQLCISFCC